MLGKMLARSVTRGLTNDLLGGLGRAAAFGAGTALVNSLLSDSVSHRPSYAPAGNQVPQQGYAQNSGSSTTQSRNNSSSVENIALARVALCYYIAKADGSISPEEQMDLDYMCSSLLNNPNASQSFRNTLQAIASNRSTSFMSVEKYLDRLDVNSLNMLLADAQHIAELTDGVTENERKAMSVFQNYIYGKQGFPGGNMNAQFAGTARVVNLKCTGCGADLEINSTKTETFCPYCGSKQIIMH